MHDTGATLEVREDDLHVPGARLRYRVTGSDRGKPWVVLENGWSGSFAYQFWLERALAPHAQVLSYDRAGIGYSHSDGALSCSGMTDQLVCLLDRLGATRPVIVIGHSYGGLIGMLHKVQAPHRIAAVVQIDPTPEFEDLLVDASLRAVPTLARVMQASAVVGLDRLLLAEFHRSLPVEVYARLRPGTAWVVKSLNGAIAEIDLLNQMRAIVRGSNLAKDCPRLVISAQASRPAATSWIRRKLSNPQKAKDFEMAAHALHQHQASLNDRSRWLSLPYSHIGLITDRSSADRIGRLALDFAGLTTHAL